MGSSLVALLLTNLAFMLPAAGPAPFGTSLWPTSRLGPAWVGAQGWGQTWIDAANEQMVRLLENRDGSHQFDPI